MRQVRNTEVYISLSDLFSSSHLDVDADLATFSLKYEEILKNQQLYIPRNYVSRFQTRKYIPSDRRYVANAFKHGVSVVKRPTTKTGQEIFKNPVLYGKLTTQVRKPVAVPKKKTGDANSGGPTPQSSKGTFGIAVKNPAPSSVDPTPDCHYELSPMLSKMVEAELLEVMKKVWELRPTDPKDAAERIVHDRFKNKAGEALRNALGLNITKRLLNVHNPLYVKMVFSGKPLRAELVAFLKKYNVTAFKRVGERGGTFAAKMHSYQDFDELCADKNLKCGKIRVTVTPCYQFMTCPANLRTPYSKTWKTNDVISDKASQAPTPTEKSTEQNVTTQNATPKDTPNKTTQTANNPHQANNTAKATPKIQTDKSETANFTPKVISSSIENKTAAKAADTKNNEQNAASKTTPVALKPTPVASKTSPLATKTTPVVSKTTPVASKPKPVASTTTPVASKTTVIASKITPIISKTTPIASKTTSVASKPIPVASKATPVASKATPVALKTTPGASKTQNPTDQSQEKPNPVVSKETPSITKVTPKAPTQAQNSSQKVTLAKVAIPQTTISKETPVKATQSQNTAKVVTPTKSATQTQNSASKVPQAQNITNPIPKQMVGSNTAKSTSKLATPNSTKIAKKVASPKVAPTKVLVGNKTKVAPKKKQSDFDELSDHDILALISEGIVLDECSGSDAD